MSLIRLASLLLALAVGINLGILVMVLIRAGDSNAEGPQRADADPDYREMLR